MKFEKVFILLIISSIDCVPIEYFNNSKESTPVQGSLSNDQFAVINVNNSEQPKNQTVADISENTLEKSTPKTLPNDVEWIDQTPKRENQQVLGTVGNLIEMIFAVSVWIFF